MSFFTSGFSSIVQKRHAKRAAALKGKAKEESKTSAEESASLKKRTEDDKEKKEAEEHLRGWVALTDIHGRPYWQHSVTGQWVYSTFVSPGTVYPSPVYHPYPHQHQHQPWVTVLPVSPVPFLTSPADGGKKEEKKEEKKEDTEAAAKAGFWETRYDEDGVRYWEHTGTKKKTYSDPFF